MARASRPIRGKGAMRREWRTEQIISPVTVKRIAPDGNAPPAAEVQRDDGGKKIAPLPIGEKHGYHDGNREAD